MNSGDSLSPCILNSDSNIFLDFWKSQNEAHFLQLYSIFYQAFFCFQAAGRSKTLSSFWNWCAKCHNLHILIGRRTLMMIQMSYCVPYKRNRPSCSKRVLYCAVAIVWMHNTFKWEALSLLSKQGNDIQHDEKSSYQQHLRLRMLWSKSNMSPCVWIFVRGLCWLWDKACRVGDVKFRCISCFRTLHKKIMVLFDLMLPSLQKHALGTRGKSPSMNIKESDSSVWYTLTGPKKLMKKYIHNNTSNKN